MSTFISTRKKNPMNISNPYNEYNNNDILVRNEYNTQDNRKQGNHR